MSAFAFRLIIVFHHIDPSKVRAIWYLGVGGYILFFFYRYEISRKRKKAVREYALIEKISRDKCLSEEERMTTTYLLSSVLRSKEDINYLTIFILSIVAVIVDLILSAKVL